MFPNLTSFTMNDHRTLRELATGDFLNAVNLTNLELNQNRLQKIECGVFSPFQLKRSRSQLIETLNIFDEDKRPLRKLRYLDLSDNEISRIEPNAFSGLSRLNFLTLSLNELTEIRRRTFNGLAAIIELWLNANKIETIENGAFDLPSLNFLHLDENKLKRLSDAVFDGLPKLQMLSSSHNELENIGRSLYHLENIHAIKLNENRIQDIDLNEFSKLGRLNRLELDRSGFTFATTRRENRDSYNNTELQYLDISDNDLFDATELNQLKIFPFLKHLDLSGNSYKNLDVGGNRTLKDILPELEWIKLRKMLNQIDISAICDGLGLQSYSLEMNTARRRPRCRISRHGPRRWCGGGQRPERPDTISANTALGCRKIGQ